MIHHRTHIPGYLILLIALSLVVAGCQASAPAATTTPSTRTDDPAGRLNLDTLPEPNAVIWQAHSPGTSSGRDTVPGPTDTHLTAILTFDSDVDNLLDMSQYGALSDNYRVGASFIRDWYPAEVQAAFEVAGDYYAITPTRYDASPFLMPPLSNGYFFSVENRLFIFAYTS